MSQKLVRKAYAKLDLGIHIDPLKSEDGLFPVSYLDCQLDLWDDISFSKEKGMEIICDDLEVPTNEENFIHKVAELLKEASGKEDLGAKIVIEKRIPMKAGFGGGSSDGAAAVFALSKLWKIKISKEQLRKFAGALGKDFYYSLTGGLCQVRSVRRNYKIKRLVGDGSFWTVVVVPYQQKPSTGWVFQNLNKKIIGKNYGQFKKLKRAILKNDKGEILANLCNDFEASVQKHFPVVSGIKRDLADSGASGKLMAGAGLSVVGFFESRSKAKLAVSRLLKSLKYKQVFLSKTIF